MPKSLFTTKALVAFYHNLIAKMLNKIFTLKLDLRKHSYTYALNTVLCFAKVFFHLRTKLILWWNIFHRMCSLSNAYLFDCKIKDNFCWKIDLLALCWIITVGYFSLEKTIQLMYLTNKGRWKIWRVKCWSVWDPVYLCSYHYLYISFTANTGTQYVTGLVAHLW